MKKILTILAIVVVGCKKDLSKISQPVIEKKTICYGIHLSENLWCEENADSSITIYASRNQKP